MSEAKDKLAKDLSGLLGKEVAYKEMGDMFTMQFSDQRAADKFIAALSKSTEKDKEALDISTAPTGDGKDVVLMMGSATLITKEGHETGLYAAIKNDAATIKKATAPRLFDFETIASYGENALQAVADAAKPITDPLASVAATTAVAAKSTADTLTGTGPKTKPKADDQGGEGGDDNPPAEKSWLSKNMTGLLGAGAGLILSMLFGGGPLMMILGLLGGGLLGGMFDNDGMLSGVTGGGENATPPAAGATTDSPSAQRGNEQAQNQNPAQAEASKQAEAKKAKEDHAKAEAKAFAKKTLSASNVNQKGVDEKEFAAVLKRAGVNPEDFNDINLGSYERGSGKPTHFILTPDAKDGELNTVILARHTSSNNLKDVQIARKNGDAVELLTLPDKPNGVGYKNVTEVMKALENNEGVPVLKPEQVRVDEVREALVSGFKPLPVPAPAQSETKQER